MTIASQERRQLLAYKAERARRYWNDVTMWRWFKLACIWVIVYPLALKYWGIL